MLHAFEIYDRYNRELFVNFIVKDESVLEILKKSTFHGYNLSPLDAFDFTFKMLKDDDFWHQAGLSLLHKHNEFLPYSKYELNANRDLTYSDNIWHTRFSPSNYATSDDMITDMAKNYKQCFFQHVVKEIESKALLLIPYSERKNKVDISVYKQVLTIWLMKNQYSDEWFFWTLMYDFYLRDNNFFQKISFVAPPQIITHKYPCLHSYGVLRYESARE